jgi:hypothetical protein
MDIDIPYTEEIDHNVFAKCPFEGGTQRILILVQAVSTRYLNLHVRILIV